LIFTEGKNLQMIQTLDWTLCSAANDDDVVSMQNEEDSEKEERDASSEGDCTERCRPGGGEHPNKRL